MAINHQLYVCVMNWLVMFMVYLPSIQENCVTRSITFFMEISEIINRIMVQI